MYSDSYASERKRRRHFYGRSRRRTQTSLSLVLPESEIGWWERVRTRMPPVRMLSNGALLLARDLFQARNQVSTQI